jgi:hypothetical protein
MDANAIDVILECDGQQTAAGSLQLPLEELGRTGVLEATTRADASDNYALRAERYGRLLSEALELAVPDVGTVTAEPTIVEVRGSAFIHSILWETLRGRPADELEVHVMHRHAVTTSAGRCIRPSQGGLIWLGARAVGDAIPRHSVAGPALAAIVERAALQPRWVLTDASAEALRQVASASASRPAEVTVVHLDVHGAVTTRPGTSGALLDSEFVALLGRHQMGEGELRQLLRDLDCNVFVSNACYGGGQRGSEHRPLPMALLEDGLFGAAVGRGPFVVGHAERFHEQLYGCLADGLSFVDAHQLALRAGAEGATLDQGWLAAVQPVLWLSDEGRSLALVGTEERPSRPDVVAEALRITARGDMFSRLLERFERAALCGEQVPELIPDNSSSTSKEKLALLGSGFAWAVGLDPTVSDDRTLAVPLPEPDEVLDLLSRRFVAPQPIGQMLAWIVGADHAEIDRLADRLGDDPYLALLESLAFGGSNFEELGDEETRKAAEFEAHFALPALGINSNPVRGQWMPPLPPFSVTDQDVRETVLAAGTTRSFDLSVLFVPPFHFGEEIRKETDPRLVVGMRQNPLLWPQSSPIRMAKWDADTALVCVTHLALAVAARQVGAIDEQSLASISALLAQRDRDALRTLVATLRDGVEGWAPLAAPVASLYDELHDELASTSTRIDQLASGEVPAYATELDLLQIQARQLINEGDIAQAQALALERIASFEKQSLFDQAESLHLLASVDEQRGEASSAIELMLKERALESPDSERRLHNREHLLRLLRRQHQGRQPELIFRIALEGADLAAGDTYGDVRARFLNAALDISCEMHEDDWLKAAIARARTESAININLLTLAEGLVALNEDPTKATELLEPLTFTTGAIAAHACVMLAGRDEKNALTYLSRGAALEGGIYSDLCRDHLLGRKLADGDGEAMQGLLEDESSGAYRPLLLYAKAAAAFEGGVKADAEEWLTQALMTDGGSRRGPILSYGVPALAVAEAALRAADRLGQELSGESAATVPPMLALQNLSRIARLAVDDAGNYRDLVRRFLNASERAWDRGSSTDMDLAAAARSHAVELMKEAHHTAAERAEAMGWLAVIQRQRDRPADAEPLFQQAIALGRDELAPAKLGALIGRYGNLQHDLGDNRSAVHLQWEGVRAFRPDRALPDHPSVEGVSALAAAPYGGSPDPWFTLLGNLGNCLRSDGQRDLARAFAIAALEELGPRSSSINPAVVALIRGLAD